MKKQITEARAIVRMLWKNNPANTLEELAARYLAVLISGQLYYNDQSRYVEPDLLLPVARLVVEGEDKLHEPYRAHLPLATKLAELDLQEDWLALVRPGWFSTMADLARGLKNPKAA